MRAINPRLNIFKQYKTMGNIINPYVFVHEISSIIADGNTLGWWKFLDPNFVNTDANGYVSSVADALGSGHNFIQNIQSLKPLLTPTGVLFDGVDDMLTLSYAVVEPQNTWIVVNVKQWVAGGSIMGKNGDDGRYLIMQSGYPNTLALYNTAYAARNPITLNKYMLVNFVYNGASSFLSIDGVKVTGNPGAIHSVTYFKLGGGGNGRCTNVEIKELIIRSVVDTTEINEAFFNYLKTKYNL